MEKIVATVIYNIDRKIIINALDVYERLYYRRRKNKKL